MTEEPRQHTLALRAVTTVIWVAWALPTILPAAADPWRLFTAAVAATSAWAVAYAVAHGVRVLGAQHRWNRRRGFDLSTNAGIGALAAALLVAVGPTLGLASIDAPVIWLLVSTFVTAWGLTVADVLVDANAAFEQERHALMNTAHALQNASDSQEAVLGELRSSIVTAVEAELAPARAAVAQQLALLDEASDDSFWTTPPRLQDVAHDSVRPLVKMLDAPLTAEPPRRNTWQFFWSVVSTQPFRPLALTGIYVASTFPSSLTSNDPPFALQLLALGVAAIVGITVGANWLMSRYPRAHARWFIAGIAMLQAPTIGYLLGSMTITLEQLVRTFTTVLVGVVVIVLVSSIGSWRSRNEHALQAFRGGLDRELEQAAERARLGALAAREAARVLHGPVQARLAACAVAIDTAVAAQDVDAYAAALRAAHDVLRSPLGATPDPSTRSSNVEEAVDDVAALWRGLIDVQVHVDQQLADDRVFSEVVSRIVEEGVTNAVRHGEATTVRVSVTQEGDLIAIRIRDDGVGPTGGRPGLGTRMLTELTQGRCSLVADPDASGAALEAFVSIN